MIFSKSWCPHCNTAKQLLQSKNQPFKAIELDLVPNGDQFMECLEQMTAQTTVPNIFVGGDHIGGNSDLQAANANGTLDAKLA